MDWHALSHWLDLIVMWGMAIAQLLTIIPLLVVMAVSIIIIPIGWIAGMISNK